jgi:HEPN domain-containing protein
LDKVLLGLEDFYIQLRYPMADGPMPYEIATRDDAERDIKLTAEALQLIQDEINHVTKKR